jgi:hypothetical protein
VILHTLSKLLESLLMRIVVGLRRSVHLVDAHGQGVHVADHRLIEGLKNRKTFLLK